MIRMWVVGQTTHQHVCYPSYVPRTVLIPDLQRSKTRLPLERHVGLGGKISSLLKTMVCGEHSLCYSKLDSALILMKS